MNFVQPIRDPELIREIKEYLAAKNKRDYMLFVVGINSALRISDILPLKVSDAKKPYFDLRETKTRKSKYQDMTPALRKELLAYIDGKKDHEYLFASQKGFNKPIGRDQAYRILRDAANHVNLDNIGTHTLRKTFGYHFYMQYKDPALLQTILNHSNLKETMRYIGIEQDAVNKAIRSFKI